MSYISVIGGGSWGTTLATLLAEKDYDVSLWVLEPEVAAEINDTGFNRVYLPDVKLPSNLKASSELEKVLKGTRYVVNVVPTQFVSKVFPEAVKHMDSECIIVNASKGIENGSYRTISSIMADLTDLPYAALSGPSFAAEVINRKPTAVTLAAKDSSTCLVLQEIFNTDYFRVYTHGDVAGVEIGGALKNVIAVAAGIAEGLGLGNSARAALITRGLAEITRLGVAMGAKEQTFSGLSGMGDLVLTCNSLLSRNFTVGYKLGQGQRLSDIMQGTKSVAEGVFTAKAAYELSKKHSIDMPIVEQVYGVIYEDKPAAVAVSQLMTRALKSEFYG